MPCEAMSRLCAVPIHIVCGTVARHTRQPQCEFAWEKSQSHLAYRAPCALGWQVGAGLLAVRFSDTSYVQATGSAHIMSAKVDEVGALRGVRLRKHTIRMRASTCSNRYSQSSIEGTHGAAIAAHNVVARLVRLGPSTRTCAAIGALVESLAVH